MISEDAVLGGLFVGCNVWEVLFCVLSNDDSALLAVHVWQSFRGCALEVVLWMQCFGGSALEVMFWR